MKTYNDFDINVRGKTSGQTKAICPQCSHKRKNKKEPCLSVNLDEGMWNCHHCKWTGSLNDRTEPQYFRPVYKESTVPQNILDAFKARGISETTVKKHKVTSENMFIPKDGKEVNCIVWNYFRDDKLINKKYRSASKGFRMESGAELVLYNLDSIRDSGFDRKVAEEIIITEGEFDCMAFDEAGFQHVLSVPNGANVNTNNLQYLEGCYDLFKDVKKIYLAVDADEAGESLLKELSRRLGKERCYRVTYPNNCKDGNQTLVEHGISAVKECIKKAEPFPLEGVITVSSVKKDVHKLYSAGIERGDIVPALGADFERLCTFKTSMLYTITGIPTHGKSTFVNNLEIQLAAEHGWKWAIFSPEHYPLEYFLYKYAEILVGQPFFEGRTQRMTVMTLDKALDFVDKHFFFIRPEGEQFTLDKILEVAKSLVFRYGVKGFTIDPWNTIEHDFGGLSETQYIERSLNKLTIFKQVHDLMIFLVAHPTKIRKDQSGNFEVPNLYDIAGSSNFYNKSDVGITVYRNFITNMTEVYIQKMKFKNLGVQDWTQFGFDIVTNRYCPNNEGFNKASFLKVEQSDIPFEDDIFNGVSEDAPF